MSEFVNPINIQSDILGRLIIATDKSRLEKHDDVYRFSQDTVDFLLHGMEKPESMTERLRHVESFLTAIKLHAAPAFDPCHPLPRSSLLLAVANQYVTFLGLAPTVRLEQFADWRIYCNEVDEEILIAAKIASLFVPKRNARPPKHRLDPELLANIVRICLRWPLLMHPLDLDFVELVQNGLRDAHIHFGELLPAHITWREAAQGAVLASPKHDQFFLYPQHELIAYFKTLAKHLLDVTVRDDSSLYLLHLLDIDDILEESVVHTIRRYLLFERLILILGFYCDMTQPLTTCREELHYVFWRYVAARTNFFQKQRQEIVGLEAFVQQEGFSHDRFKHTDFDHLIVSSLYDSNATCLDVRVMAERDKNASTRFGFEHNLGRVRRLNQNATEIRKDFKKNYKKVFKHPPSAPLPELKINVVLGFTKDQAWKTKRNFGARPENWRKKRRELVEAVLEILHKQELAHRDPKMDFRINALDTVTSEYGFDVGVVAPAYDLVSFRKSPFLELDTGPLTVNRIGSPERRMRKYYHNGEDRENPITAARVSWEAVQWLRMAAGDRLGHLTFLAYGPREVHITETRGERLDNLLWLFALFNKHDTNPSVPLNVADLRLEIESISRYIHPPVTTKATGSNENIIELDPPHIIDLINAWLLRPFNENSFIFPATAPASESDVAAHFMLSPLCIFPAKPPCSFTLGDHLHGVPYAYLGFAGIPELYRTELAHFHPALKATHARRSEMMVGVYSKDLVGAALETVTNLILRRGVFIETCPTSNLLIGSNFQDSLPGALLEKSILSNNLLIGTDDPASMNTDITVELAQLLCRLIVEHGMPRQEVMDKARAFLDQERIPQY